MTDADEQMIEACAGGLTLWGVPRQIGRKIVADNIKRRRQETENADGIWLLHSRTKLMCDEVIDSDIVRVLRVAMEALATAGTMADARNMKGGRREQENSTS